MTIYRMQKRDFISKFFSVRESVGGQTVVAFVGRVAEDGSSHLEPMFFGPRFT